MGPGRTCTSQICKTIQYSELVWLDGAFLFLIFFCFAGVLVHLPLRGGMTFSVRKLVTIRITLQELMK